MKTIIFTHVLARHDDMQPVHAPAVMTKLSAPVSNEVPDFEDRFAANFTGCALYRGMNRATKTTKILFDSKRSLSTFGAGTKNYRFSGVWKVVCPDALYSKIKNQHEVLPDAPPDVYFVRVKG